MQSSPIRLCLFRICCAFVQTTTKSNQSTLGFLVSNYCCCHSHIIRFVMCLWVLFETVADNIYLLIILQIATVPALHVLSSLQYLDLSYNAMRDGFEKLYNLPKIKFMFIDNNRFDFDQDTFNDVRMQPNTICCPSLNDCNSKFLSLSLSIDFDHFHISTSWKWRFCREVWLIWEWTIIHSVKKFDNTKNGYSPTFDH